MSEVSLSIWANLNLQCLVIQKQEDLLVFLYLCLLGAAKAKDLLLAELALLGIGSASTTDAHVNWTAKDFKRGGLRTVGGLVSVQALSRKLS